MVIFRQTSNETERPRDVCVAEYFAAQYYFRFPTCWCHCIQKVKVYQQTNFRRHISIHGWDIITSVLEKNVRHIGILLPVSSLVISPQSACDFASGSRIASKSDNLLQKYDVISIFQDGGRGRSILLPVSYLLVTLLQKVNVYQRTKFRRHTSIRGLRYNYFRFGKTNVRCLEIRLPVSISTISP